MDSDGREWVAFAAAGGMEPLRPAVGSGFRFRKDLLPSAAHPFGLHPQPPSSPPPVSHGRLLSRVHNPALRKIIATDRARARAQEEKHQLELIVPVLPRRRLQTPEPDVSVEWETLQQARPSQARREATQQSRRALKKASVHVASPPRMPQPPAAFSRAAARQAVRAAFDHAHEGRGFWDGASGSRRAAKLQPPARLATDTAFSANPGPTAVWPSPSSRKPSARPWVPH